jgi:hypothetical protein
MLSIFSPTYKANQKEIINPLKSTISKKNQRTTTKTG